MSDDVEKDEITAKQIPVEGNLFKIVNVCSFVDDEMVALNFQKNENPNDDERYKISLYNAMDLVCDLSRAIEKIEDYICRDNWRK